eukprot:CAMPEP_0173365902 /NCGR_PEP_ID=MMETSP1144-20121109/23904_1 /TAXON_ID=483371 /ORGANISM="non described non described, Strain CCMP2298" /LENGTH=91 /DNA_ID=CAMNT_0014316425 /DNA_START=155 /DNA_END=425 /DNA_ORIENTATION=+
MTSDIDLLVVGEDGAAATLQEHIAHQQSILQRPVQHTHHQEEEKAYHTTNNTTPFILGTLALGRLLSLLSLCLVLLALRLLQGLQVQLQLR